MLQAAARRGRRATWINTGLAIAVVAAGVAAYLSVRDPGTTTTATTRTATVSTGSVTASVTGSGNLTSASTVGVSFTAGGTLTSVDVTVGQVVKAGQKLAAIDPASLRTSLDSAQAQLTSAQASYDQTAAGATTYQRQKDALAVSSAQAGVDSAQASLTSAKSQLATDTTAQNALVAAARAALTAGTGTQAQVDAAVATRTQTLAKDNQSITTANQQVASAKNQLAQQKVTQQQNLAGANAAQLAQASASLQSAQNSVATARTNLDGATLTAPVGGTVVSVGGVVGQSVSGGSSSSANSSSSSGSGGGTGGANSSSSSSSSSSSTTGFVVLSDLTRLQVTANIAEADIASVTVGQAATVTLSASTTQTTGKVTAIAVQPTTSNNVVTYPVTVTLDQPPEQARLGASVTISITTGSAENVLVAPTSAVTTLGRRHTVTVLKGGVQTVTQVQVGLVGDNGTEITGGLSDGDVLVLPTTTTSSTGNGFPRIGGLGGRG